MFAQKIIDMKYTLQLQHLLFTFSEKALPDKTFILLL